MARRQKKRRRHIHFGNLFLVLLVFAGIVAGVFLGGVKVYHRFLGERTIQEVLADRTSSAHPRDHSEDVAAIRQGSALDQVSVSGFSDEELRSLFYGSPLTDAQIQQITGSSYFEGQDFITLDDLRCVRVLYMDFSGATRIGELIVNADIADDVEKIFYDLYIRSYPIGKIALADTYQGSESENMEANNTFGLLFSQKGSMDQDAFNSGCAVTINPLYNPKVTEVYGKTVVTPASAYTYANRKVLKKYMISQEDYAYELFTDDGFHWGGDDKTTQSYGVFWKDYMKKKPAKEDEETSRPEASYDVTENDQDSSQEKEEPEYDMYGKPLKDEDDKEEEDSQQEVQYDIYGNPVYSTPDPEPEQSDSQNSASQIIGYDYYGNPIYSDSQDSSSQIIGYDYYGNPIYSSADTRNIIGYDYNGNPIYDAPPADSQEEQSTQ